MILGTYHCHTEFCDGKSTAEEMVLAAIAAGAEEIGITPHSPVSAENWCIAREKIKKYLAEADRLKKKYSDKIRVYAGIEYDALSRVNRDDYDFIIGSSHSVVPDGNRFWVDLSASEVRENVNKYYHSDPYSYVEEYFDRVSNVYEITKCDIIAHFDLVTKFLEVDPLFDTEHPRYVAARDKALDKLLQSPAIFEVNTGAISRGYRTTPYPEDTVLRRIAESGKPVVINSDSHSKETVLFGIREEMERLDSMGIKYVKTMEELLSFTRK